MIKQIIFNVMLSHCILKEMYNLTQVFKIKPTKSHNIDYLCLLNIDKK